MNCRGTRARLRAMGGGSLPLREARAVAAHVAGCPECRAEWELERRLTADLAALRLVPVEGPDVRARVLRDIEALPVPGAEAFSRRDLAWAASALLVVGIAAVGTATSWGPAIAEGAARALGGLLGAASGSIAPTTELATVLFSAARATARALLPGPRVLGPAFLVIHATALSAGAAAILASAAIAGREIFLSRPRTR